MKQSANGLKRPAYINGVLPRRSAPSDIRMRMRDEDEGMQVVVPSSSSLIHLCVLA
jgi:hypothetical protein